MSASERGAAAADIAEPSLKDSWATSDRRRKPTKPAMPYAANADLPPSVRGHLPSHAQDIYRNAFNHAWATYGARDPAHVEEIAHRVAWAAVKKRYHKVGDAWMPRED